MRGQEFVSISKSQLDQINEILSGAEDWIDRGQAATVLTAISAIEDVFEDVIKSRMVVLSKKMESRLFQGYGPLNTFAAKIDIAFALGLLSERDYADMQIIRKVRNEFAHSRAVTGFEKKEIADLVGRLSKPKKEVDWAYDWYFSRAAEIGYAMIDAAMRLRAKATGKPANRRFKVLASRGKRRQRSA